MMDSIKETFSERIFRVKILSEKISTQREMKLEKRDFVQPGAPLKASVKIGRNDPCPCGSGKKYKHCHGKGL